MAEKIEKAAERQPIAEQAKPKAKPEKPAKKQKPADEIVLPVLVEFIFAGSAIILIVVFLMVSAVSWFSGATPLDFALRGGVSILSLGGLLSLFSRQVSTGVLNAEMAEIEEEQKKTLFEEAQDGTNENLPKAQ